MLAHLNHFLVYLTAAASGFVTLVFVRRLFENLDETATNNGRVPGGMYLASLIWGFMVWMCVSNSPSLQKQYLTSILAAPGIVVCMIAALAIVVGVIYLIERACSWLSAPTPSLSLVTNIRALADRVYPPREPGAPEDEAETP